MVVQNRQRRTLARAVCAPVEALERRTLLASVAWTNPLGGDFNDPANWSTNTVPGPGDDVLINADLSNINTYTYQITLNGSASVNSLNLGAPDDYPTLLLTSGTLTLAAASQINFNGTLVLQNATVAGAGGLSDAGVLASRGAANAINTPLSVLDLATLRVQGNATYGAAALTIADGFNNSGAIDLTSADGAFASTLNVSSGTLVNAAGRVVSSSAGSGGGRTLVAQLDNQGTLDVHTPLTISKAGASLTNSGTIRTAGGDLTVALSGGGTFTNTGTLTAGAGRTIAVTGGTLINQGTLRGSGTFAATVSNAATVSPDGQGQTLSYEPFDYANGSLLDGQGQWWEVGRNDIFSDDYATPEIIQPASLSFPGLATAGRSVQTSGMYSYDLHDSGASGYFGGAGNTYWFSFLIQQNTDGVHGPHDADYGGIIFGNAPDANQLFVGRTGDGTTWGLQNSGGLFTNLSSTNAVLGQTAFLTVKITFHDAANPNPVTLDGQEEIKLYVNAAPGTSEGSLVPAASANMEMNSFNKIAISTGTNANWTFDEIRGGTTFAAVAPTAFGTATFAGGYAATSAATTKFDLAGASQFDRLVVNGTVSLAGTLSLNPTFAAGASQSFTLIDNDGADAVSGNFQGLPEGALFQAGGKTFRISYSGGDGNDVTVTYLPGFAINDVAVVEGTGGTTNAVFTVYRSDANASSVTVHYATANGTATAGSDYTTTSGPLTFGANVVSQTISVPITTDSTSEADETFTVVLSSPSGGVPLGRATGTGTILNDDTSVPIVTASFASVVPDPRSTSLASLGISFSEPVNGFDTSDLSLSRDGFAIALSGVTLSSGDNQNFTIAGLSALTANAGTYTITLASSGTGIVSVANGTAIAGGAMRSWKMNTINGTPGADTIRLARNAATSLYDVFINNTTATPDYSFSAAALDVVNVVGNGGGGDVLTIAGAAGAGDSFTFSNTQIARVGGTATFVYSAFTTLAFDTGTFGSSSDLNGLSLAAGPGVTTVNLNSTQHLGSLNIGAGSVVRVAGGGDKVLLASNLSLAGILDLTNEDLVLDYSAVSPLGTWNGSAYDGITALVASGRNGGAWNGASGIVTSAASGNFTTLAVAESSQVLGIGAFDTALFDGQTVDGSAVIVKFTYGGDANLDGKINVDDYGRIDFNVNLATSNWFNGDFNYDGKVNVDDYGIIDFNVGIQNGIL